MREAIQQLEHGMWPAAMGPPPSAWSKDYQRNTKLARRLIAELQELLDGENDTDDDPPLILGGIDDAC